jgi:hypothetical protein
MTEQEARDMQEIRARREGLQQGGYVGLGHHHAAEHHKLGPGRSDACEIPAKQPPVKRQSVQCPAAIRGARMVAQIVRVRGRRHESDVRFLFEVVDGAGTRLKECFPERSEMAVRTVTDDGVEILPRSLRGVGHTRPLALR